MTSLTGLLIPAIRDMTFTIRLLNLNARFATYVSRLLSTEQVARRFLHQNSSRLLHVSVANTFLVLLSFTPLLLHFLAKRFPVNIYYNHDTKTFTSVHYNFFLRKMAFQFKASEVVDAQVAPEMNKVWIPLATAFVHNKPLLISLDRNAYVDKLAFDEMTKNITIPKDHD
ncbi:unnamed protein product [Heligmosomoides polygyrus]|uniref:Transmembrane protein n=1 Tax=Heligmosomoides polygyrus TaxID=6339 RepID=A0A183FM23_HELPZ|nr:unnamed protein product [Heligmosomoides polygyrus]